MTRSSTTDIFLFWKLPFFGSFRNLKRFIAYSEAERNKRPGSSAKTVRLPARGWAKSAHEFKQFIEKKYETENKVEHAPKSDAQHILSFYMGKNTPERKDYIMENLVVPIEDWSLWQQALRKPPRRKRLEDLEG